MEQGQSVRSAGAGERAQSRLFDGSRRWPVLAVWVLILLYIAYFGWYTLHDADVHLSRGGDLAIYDQAVWNTTQGRPLRSTSEEGWVNLLGDHVEPILLPLALTYLVWSDGKMLLLVQTVALALGALPVYGLARQALRTVLDERTTEGPDQPVAGKRDDGTFSPLGELAAVVFALIFLLQPALHDANLFEFHPSVLAVPFLLATFYFLYRRRPVPALVFVILTMSTKESMPLTTFALGFYLIVFSRQRLLGAIIAVLSAVWFVLAVFVVVPYFNTQGQSIYFSTDYQWLGSSGGEIVTRVLRDPGLVWQRLVDNTGPAYLARLLGPLAYVPLFGLPLLLVGAPTLLLNALSDTSVMHSLGSFFHYAAPLVPVLVVAAIAGTAWLTRSLGRLGGRFSPGRLDPAKLRLAVALAVTALILVAAVVAQWRQGFLPFSRDFYVAPRTDRIAAIDDLLDGVPSEGSLSTDLYPDPRLSHRADLYIYPVLHDADYVVVDVSVRDGPFHARDRYEALQQLLDSGGYGVRDGRYGILFLERGLQQSAIPEAFYDFAKARESAPQYETVVDFGDGLRLLGFDLVWENPLFPRAYLVLYWQALQPAGRDLRLFFVQTDPGGEPIPGTEMEFTEPVWYPPARWTATEVVRTETFHWNLETPGRFGVAIGVVEGPGFWDLDQRLPPVVHSAPWEMPAVHGDTLLYLASLRSDGQFVTLEENDGQR